MNWENFLTVDGKKHYDFFRKHDLGRFYNPMMGNLCIDNDDWETVKESVLQFIAEYWEQQWVLSHNADCEQWFVHQLED
jgi:hypothetical protein